jgi:hypothetical protein
MVKFCTVLFVTLLVHSGSCQNIEQGWKGIKSLKSSRAEVEKILGKGEVDRSGYFRYSVPDAFVRINYSVAPCSIAPMNRGKFRIPENTVIDYYVVPKESLRLEDLKFNREEFYKDTSGDVTDKIVYANQSNSILINVDNRNGSELVATIYFNPTKIDSEILKCD